MADSNQQQPMDYKLLDCEVVEYVERNGVVSAHPYH